MSTEDFSVLANPEFIIEYISNFTAGKSKNFSEFLEEIQKAAASIPLTNEVLAVTADDLGSEFENMFAITLRIRTSSWFSGGEILNETIKKVFLTAQAVEYDVYDTALERWQKSQNERLVSRLGSNTKTIEEAA